MNFQNIPRGNKVIQKAFVPKLDAFLFFDYKQIEPRFLAYYLDSIGDTKLAEHLRDGDDTYTSIIAQYYGREDITDAERDEGKRLFLSLMYGGGTPTVRAQFGVDQGQAWKMTTRFHNAWPGIRRLQKLIDQVMDERGFVRTPWGRHLAPPQKHKRLNALIQGSAADLMRYALINVDDLIKERGCESHMVSVIHDEIILDCKMEDVPWLVKEVPACMDYAPVSKVVPILTDTEWSVETWADKQSYTEV